MPTRALDERDTRYNESGASHHVIKDKLRWLASATLKLAHAHCGDSAHLASWMQSFLEGTPQDNCIHDNYRVRLSHLLGCHRKQATGESYQCFGASRVWLTTAPPFCWHRKARWHTPGKCRRPHHAPIGPSPGRVGLSSGRRTLCPSW